MTNPNDKVEEDVKKEEEISDYYYFKTKWEEKDIIDEDGITTTFFVEKGDY